MFVGIICDSNLLRDTTIYSLLCDNINVTDVTNFSTFVSLKGKNINLILNTGNNYVSLQPLILTKVSDFPAAVIGYLLQAPFSVSFVPIIFSKPLQILYHYTQYRATRLLFSISAIMYGPLITGHRPLLVFLLLAPLSVVASDRIKFRPRGTRLPRW